MNKHNVQIWGAITIMKLAICLGIAKEAVWCALSVDEVLESYYFDAPIVNGESFLHLSSQYSLQMLPTLPENNIFQQDGVPAP